MADLGVLLAPPDNSGSALAELARTAERSGLDLVVVADDLDPWSTAAWVAAATTRIPIGLDLPAVADPDLTDPAAPYPAVVDKARQSLDLLTGPRLLDGGWVLAEPDVDAARVRELAAPGQAVVVP